MPARNVGSRRPVARSHDAALGELRGPSARERRPAAAGRAARGAAPVTRESGRRATRRGRWPCWQKRAAYDPTKHRAVRQLTFPSSTRDRVIAARQRGACRGASEAEGAGAATVTGMGRLWPARTRKRPRKASTVVRRARRPAPIRFAMPRRAPRVRALPTATRGRAGTAAAPIESWLQRHRVHEARLRQAAEALRDRGVRDDRAVDVLGDQPARAGQIARAP